jgi:hypothetical protein
MLTWDEDDDLSCLKGPDGYAHAHVAFNVCGKNEWDWQARSGTGPTTFGEAKTREEAKEAAESAVWQLLEATI